MTTVKASDAVGAPSRRPQGSESKADRSPLMCRAGLCPCAGTNDPAGTGAFYCSWHLAAPPAHWPRVTDALIDHQWLIDHISELQRLHARAGHGKPWLAVARTFWHDEAAMMPTEFEAERWSYYVWRLREELAFRVGVRPDRPDPLVPAGRQPEWRDLIKRPMRQGMIDHQGALE